jgi:hypothetical protein
MQTHRVSRRAAARTVWAAAHIVLILLTGCSPPSAPPTPSIPAATPTLLGTVPGPAAAAPTPTPRAGACIFRPSPATEIGVYRFNWDNATFTLDAKPGPVIVDGPRNLNPGPRQLILAHDVNASTSLNVVLNFDLGGSLVYDLRSSAQEVRDAGGTVFIQTLADSVGDVRGLPPYLDIVRLERTFGYFPNSLVRIYLGGVRSGPPIWTFQNLTVSLGDELYTRRSSFDDQTALTVTDAQGRTQKWQGPVTVEENIVTFALQTGWKDPVSAATSTSGGDADATHAFPVETMQQIWEAALQRCP